MRSIGERYAPAMLLDDPSKAEEYFEELVVEHLQSHVGATRELVVKVERENLAYWAGFYSDETRERVERLFKCFHPVFGSIAINGPPTLQDAQAAALRDTAALKSE